MKTAFTRWAMLPVLSLLAFNLNAAYLESDSGSPLQPRVRIEPSQRIMPPHRDGGNALTRLVQRIEVGTPYSYRGLTVFPLELRSGFRPSDLLTLDDAISRDALVVREKGSGEVPVLLVRNDAPRPVFLMSGEIVLGGKQNRLIRDDTLLPPRSGFTEIAVYCGEQGRWTGPEPVFKSAPGVAAPALRELAAKSASQDGIWREIDGQLDRAAVRSPTRSYHQIYEDREAQRRLDECVRELQRCCGRETVGCVMVIGGRLRGCDLFSDPSVFARLWEKICRSYGTEVVFGPVYRDWDRESRGRDWSPGVGREDVRRFVDRCLSASFSSRSTPGIGELLNISGPVTGNVLVHDEAVVHAALFSDAVEIRPPPPRPIPPEPRPMWRE